MGIIRLGNIKVYAFHGCLEEESKIGSDYIVNVELHTSFEEAAESDDLSKTIDYVKVNRVVHRQMELRSKLIETVAYRIAAELKSSFPQLNSGTVEVVKVNPPMGGHVDTVSVVVDI